MSDPNPPAPPDLSNSLDYARPGLTPGRISLGRVVAIAIVSVLGVAFLVALLLPSLGRAREPANRVKCASNMRQIGQAIAMYANDHGGLFPADLKTIFENEDVTASVFTCPSSNDTPAPTAATTQATAAGLLQPGHLSYVYLGKGMTDQAAATDAVILYEPLTNHSSAGTNVMFGDFHVEWLSAAEAGIILKQVAAKRAIVRYPLTAPTAAPSK